MSLMAFAAALLLPLALGAGSIALLGGRPVAAWAWLRLSGEGFLLGLLIVAGMMMLPGIRPADSFAALGLPIAAIAIGLLVAARRAMPQPAPSAPLAPLELALSWLSLGLIGLHVLPLWYEACQLPTLPWDAWSTWMYKARAWFEQETFLPFVDPGAAVAQPGRDVLATLAPHYPNAVPRFAVWVASAQGEWSGMAVRLLWPVLWLALGACCYGGLRALGLAASVAAVASAALLSLPLLNHHAALAGYADLWLATLLLMAALRLAAFVRERRRADAVLALAFALLLPALKLEGAVWLLGLIATAAIMLLPRVARGPVVLGAVLLVAVLAATVGLVLPVPGLGMVALSWGEAVIPGVGTLELYWRPVGDEVLATLFRLPNWHLLWFLWPFLLGWRWRVLRRDPAAAALAWFTLYAGAFLFVLFFFTDASRWAENLTSVNRVLLQVVPTMIALAALGFRPSPADADRSR